MAAILQFQLRKSDIKREFAPDHSATIIIYNGVRIERLDDQQIAEARAQREINGSTRIA
jgi:hypothetical protein